LLVVVVVVRRLYVGRNRGGDLAERELQKYSVQYVVIKGDDEKTEPVLVTEEGYFEGLEKIKEYAKYWTSMSKYGSNVRNSVYVY